VEGLVNPVAGPTLLLVDPDPHVIDGLFAVAEVHLEFTPEAVEFILLLCVDHCCDATPHGLEKVVLELSFEVDLHVERAGDANRLITKHLFHDLLGKS